MARGKKTQAQAPSAPSEATAAATRAVPTEEEVKRALEGNGRVNAPAEATTPKKNSNTLFYIAVAFGLAAVGLLLQLMRDDQFLRTRLKRQFPWQNTILDRLAALFGVFVSFLVTTLVFARRELLRSCRSTWRTQRKELLIAYKDGWKHRKQIGFQYLILISSIAAAAVFWRLVIAATNCDAPIVVVLSGSMETAFYRGDLLFLTNYAEDPIIPGEIVVFKIDGRDIPIVHRVMQSHMTENGTFSFLTKGDNNQGNDRTLYAPGQLWLERRHIVGRAKFFLPYVGMITVKLNEYPAVKMLVIVGMIGMMLYSREL
jgi:signal peptidase